MSNAVGDPVATRSQTMPATCRRAVARAVLAPPGEEAATARIAAEALVAAATSGDASALAEVLRPDPTVPVSTWAVARYRAGDVSPSRFEQHDDPCAAVLATAATGAAHEATAELIAISGGLRWTPLVHGHSGLSFHRPEAWAIAESEASGAEAAAAADRWHRRARLWAEVPRSKPEARSQPSPTSTPPKPAAQKPTSRTPTARPAPRTNGSPKAAPRAEPGAEQVTPAAAAPEPPRRSVDGSAVVGGDVALPTLAALTARLEAAVIAHERSAAALTALVDELRRSRTPPS